MPSSLSHVCPRCFEDRALKIRIAELRGMGRRGACTIHKSAEGVELAFAANLIGRAFRKNYQRSDHYDAMENEYLGDDLTDLVQLLTGAVDQRITDEICQLLIESDDLDTTPFDEGPFFTADAAYTRAYSGNIDQNLWWFEFRHRIQFDQRFFNSEAKALLSDIFENVHLLLDVYRRSPIVTLRAAETTLYRARIVGPGQEEQDVIDDPAGQLGPPPEAQRRQGRMNAAGILAFYGAFEAETCVAELRPPVGSRIAWAAFKPTRPLVMLDLTRFQAPPKERNIFSTSASTRLSQWLFMQGFMNEISAPILPGDEVFEYIPTQVVAEYLVRHHNFGRAKTHKAIDGMVYHSAQRAGQGDGNRNRDTRNVVLFGEAATVEGTESARPRSMGRSMYRSVEDQTVVSKPGLRFKPHSFKIRKVTGVEISICSVVDADDPNEPPAYYQ